MTRRVALLPGDGVGPDVVAEAVRVLQEAADGFSFEFTEFSVGAGEYLRNGDPLPDKTLDELRKFDAILLGAMGLPDVRRPDGTEMTPQLDIREKLDLFCGLRPICLYHTEDSPLKNKEAGAIDLLLVRESTEGLFSTRLRPVPRGASAAEDVMRITRAGAERVIRAAFEQARLRRCHCTLVDKANVLPSMAYFRRVFDEVAPEYPDVATNRVYVDACALYLVRYPERFDVMVTENMFGDILSDLTAALVGGMGMAPSADIGTEHAVFQPSHGSAPDIAGQGIANPVATVLSAAMMLEWFGTDEEKSAAGRIRTAVRSVFADPSRRTADMGGTLTTRQMTDALLRAL